MLVLAQWGRATRVQGDAACSRTRRPGLRARAHGPAPGAIANLRRVAPVPMLARARPRRGDSWQGCSDAHDRCPRHRAGRCTSGCSPPSTARAHGAGADTGLTRLARIRVQRPDFVVQPPPTTAPEPPVRRSIPARPEPKAIRTGDGFVTVIATGERVYYPGCAAHGVHCHPEGQHTDFCRWAFEMGLLEDDDRFEGRLG